MEDRMDISNEEKLEWLMNEYGGNVARLTFTYMKQKQLAEDVAQEVFIKCYENLDNFRYEDVVSQTISLKETKDLLKSFRPTFKGGL